MDFMDKVNKFAKTAAEKTTEFADDARLKAQIANDEKSIKELEIKLGAYYFEKFAAGEEVDEDVREVCTAILVHKANIEEKKAALNVKKSTSEDEATDDPFEL
ncbi:MAG: hypothetical protein LUE24_12395 [Lachnospiraceae bacterium]|nr:hypothetical protein [Lachnospiraceae bacterium]